MPTGLILPGLVLAVVAGLLFLLLRRRRKRPRRHVVDADRCAFVRRHFFQWSLSAPEGFLPDPALFRQLTHPAELHYLASVYNWDDGSQVLEWVLRSELCTRATANLLFWRAAPDWYLRCDIEDESGCDAVALDGFRVLRLIVEKYRSGSFSPYDIRFDPRDEMEPVTESNPRWTFPSGVHDVIDGVEVVFED